MRLRRRALRACWAVCGRGRCEETTRQRRQPLSGRQAPAPGALTRVDALTAGQRQALDITRIDGSCGHAGHQGRGSGPWRTAGPAIAYKPTPPASAEQAVKLIIPLDTHTRSTVSTSPAQPTPIRHARSGTKELPGRGSRRTAHATLAACGALSAWTCLYHPPPRPLAGARSPCDKCQSFLQRGPVRPASTLPFTSARCRVQRLRSHIALEFEASRPGDRKSLRTRRPGTPSNVSPVQQWSKLPRPPSSRQRDREHATATAPPALPLRRREPAGSARQP